MGPGDLQEITQGLNQELGPDSEPNQLGQEATATAAGGDPFGRRRRDPAVLVSTETGDDAGVYLVRPEGSAGVGIVQTADFITPPFDDPEGYGQIAAANALSDVYAMGGRPISALNLCVFPPGLVTASARAILRGASDKLREAGAVLLGGHTVRGPELLFGLAVTGVDAPAHIWRNDGARDGDALLLTKPLGCGLVVTGSRKGLVSDAERLACLSGMTTLNRRAAEVLAQFAVHAATDVTGFGLVGHALGMTGLGDVSLVLRVSELPVYPGALALAAQGVTCGGAKSNRRAYKDRLAVEGSLSAAYEELIFDPQTSGGLLCALPAAAAAAALDALRAAGVAACRVGEVRPRATAALIVCGDAGACS
ncbi:MAG TPA: selenide, water dikinase SelD [Pseudomonadota bacterium]|nr:selenide, water dikinase SelD [Pseudomonadota bacterium]